MRTRITHPIAETAAGAAADAVLRACVHCGLCNATCPTYQITGDELDGPRGRIYLIKQVLEGEDAGPLTQLHLDRCLSCRACETTCPSGVEYHRLYDIGRQIVADGVPRPAPDRLVRWLIRKVAAWPARFRPVLWLGRLVRALPSAPSRPARSVAAQPTDRHVVMLGGCVQAAAAEHFNAATARVLGAIGVGATQTEGCCGSLSAHLDAPDEARAFARRNVERWTRALDDGAEAVVINSSGCAAFVRDYPDLFRDDEAMRGKAERVAAAVRDPIELLTEASLTPSRQPSAPRIAVHEPCTQQHGLKLGGRVAALLRRLGYQPQPVAGGHLCCGSAGAYSLLQPKIAGRLRADKLAALTAQAPEAIFTANIGCWLHLGQASPVPVRHWIEAVEDVL